MSQYTEWLEADGCGGYALGSSDLLPRRRYHSLLTVAVSPPTHRFTLVNGLDVTATTAGGSITLTPIQFWSGPLPPSCRRPAMVSRSDLVPTWRWQSLNGHTIELSLLKVRNSQQTHLSWRISGGEGPCQLSVRPLLASREHHSLHNWNESLCSETQRQGTTLVWHLYPTCPRIFAATTAPFTEAPTWYYGLSYSEDIARGYPGFEDLFSPGYFTIGGAAEGPVYLTFGALTDSESVPDVSTPEVEVIWRKEVERRLALPSMLDRAAEQYLVQRQGGLSIIAGYPWFTDWGRDTCIALRGLTVARERYPEAMAILLLWAEALSEGMVPNVFPDGHLPPLYNSVDASLWYVVAAFELMHKMGDAIDNSSRQLLIDTSFSIINSYRQGTRFRIRMTDDALLASGLRGTQLTWMDAKHRDIAFTPRIGKPVEVNALWIASLRAASQVDRTLVPTAEKATNSFIERFWNPQAGCLFDVVDVNHIPGENDPTIRPNQILAVGGLPIQIINGDQAAAVVATVESLLVTPHGVRSLDPHHPDYHGEYRGGQYERDAAYHQGTAWSWLLGPFVEAWVRVNGDNLEAREQAYRKFLAHLVEEVLPERGGHLPEVSDASPPFAFHGCPMQAWSVGEIVRVLITVLGRKLPHRAQSMEG